VICGVRRYGDPCREEHFLLTLRKDENPDQVVQSLLGLAYRASGPIVQSEDGSPQHYYDMNLFLRVREASVEEDN
jgi:hypothetical protein